MHIVITGAANGIGEALVQEIIKKEASGHKISLVDIDETKAKEVVASCGTIPGSEAFELNVFQADLADMAALPKVHDRLVKKAGPVDLLINNVGIMLVQKIETMSWERAESQLNLNYMSPLRLINLTLPSMIERGIGGKNGAVGLGPGYINVASMAGLTPIPGCGYYCATKAGIAMASEILRGEIKEHGLTVTTVYPGPISTALEKGARAGLSKGPNRDLLPVGDRFQIAERIYSAYCRKKERVIYPDFYALARHFPGPVYWLAENISPKPVS